MLYPPIAPYASGLLKVTDGNRIYWETAGNPDGVPVLHLHGGPGSGLGAGGYRRRCDPDRHLIVGIDQRGCGRSRPWAIEAWDRFRRSSHRRPGERLVEAYRRRLVSDDAGDRVRAAQGWNDWENAHICLDADAEPDRGAYDERARNFATLVTHYWAHDAFLPGEQAILHRIGEIDHVPAVLIHGRRDVSGPAITAWQLHQRWPVSDLVVVDGEGHGGPVMVETMIEAIGRLAR